MRTLVLGTAGHIDHGKSALVEALTGVHPDRLKEEQARGITIELGFAHVRIGDLSVALVDVPGHERFVRTMLAGAGGLDAVLLVVAANESVMPQTREHFDICRLLGIARGLIVLTKSDLVDADTLALAELDARELVAGSPLADAPVLAVSARTGEGIDALRDAMAALAESTPARPRAGRARVPIDRAFSVKGFGTVVTGTLVTGALAVDDALTLLPAGRAVRVRGVQVHGETVAVAAAPRRVAVNLGGVDLADVHRGMTLASPDSLAVTRRADVRIDLLPGSPALRHGARVRVHHGTSESVASVLVSALRPDAAAPWTPVTPGDADVRIAPGGQACARLRLASPLALTRDDRFVLRLPSPARTIGGGIVLDPEPARGGVRRAGVAARFALLDDAALTGVLPVWIGDAGLTGMTVADLVRRSGTDAGAIESALDDLQQAFRTEQPGFSPAVTVGLKPDGSESRIVRCGTHVVSAERLTSAAAEIGALITAFHQAHPAEAGMPREEVRAKVAGTAAASTFEAALERAGVRQVGHSDRLALPSHRPVVDDEETRVRDDVVRQLRDAGLQPPDVNGLAADAGTQAVAVQRALQALVKERRVLKLGDLWFHPEVLGALKDRVRSMGAGATVDVAAAKAHFGVSRKFAIPLLEYLDRERVTRRVGDRRVVL